MKTLKALAAWALVMIGAAAWGDLQPLVQLSSIRREFAGTAQSGKLLKVEGLSSTKWTAKSNVSWIKLTKASGKGGESVSYSVEENDGDEDREGEITVISNGQSSTFTVRQAADVFTISPHGHYILSPGQCEFTLTVKSGGTNVWKAKSHQNWVTIKSGASGRGNGKIICSVEVNKTGKPRWCKITVLKDHRLKTHWSEQRGSLYDGTGWTPGWVALTSTEREFTYAASSKKELKVKSNTFWEAYSEDGWINLETLEGAGNGTIVYGIDANNTTTERTGTIKVTGGENTVSFTVKQKGRPARKLKLGESSASLGATGTGVSGKTVAVEANLNWTAKSQDSWIKVTGGASGKSNGTVTYYVGAYLDTGTRSGSITVEGSGLTRSFTVHQKGPDPSLSLGSASRTFAASGGTGKELKVTGNVSWTAKSSASWLTVKKGSGKGIGTVVYDVAKNTGSAERTAGITVTGGGLTRTFLVRQNGTGGSLPTTTLTLGASERTFTADAAKSKELSVTANVSWTAKSSASWLAVKTTSGSGNGKIVYDVAANADSTARTATITVEGGGLTRTFTVKQDGKSSGGGGGQTATLTLGASERTFTADAANGKELKVTADVAWTAKSSASWLVVKTASGSGNGKIVYNVAANSSASARTATITVAGGGLTRTFTVKQDGKSDPKSLKPKSAAPRVRVTTSDGSDGAAAADGDEATAWSPSTAEGSWVALTFDEERPVDAVNVLGERLPDGLRVLVSEDGDTWSEEGGDAVNYLWLLLPGEGEIPAIREITTEP